MAAIHLAIGFVALLLPPDVSAADLARFPPPGVAESWVEFQDQQLAWLETQLLLGPVYLHEQYGDQLCDLHYRRYCWNLAAAAGNCARNDNEAQALVHLKELRGVLGPLAYCRGRLPDPVDLRRFQWMD